jgi:hypothetical protein
MDPKPGCIPLFCHFSNNRVHTIDETTKWDKTPQEEGFFDEPVSLDHEVVFIFRRISKASLL